MVFANTCNITYISQQLSTDSNTLSCVKAFNLSTTSDKNVLTLMNNQSDTAIFFTRTDCITFLNNFLDYMYTDNCDINGYTSEIIVAYVNSGFNLNLKLENISSTPNTLPPINETNTIQPILPTLPNSSIPKSNSNSINNYALIYQMIVCSTLFLYMI